MTLFELCKKLQWPMPTFNTVENKSRSELLSSPFSLNSNFLYLHTPIRPQNLSLKNN